MGSWKKKAEDECGVYRANPKHINKSLKMSLPLPPSVNSMYFNKRNGAKQLTTKAQHYIRDSRALINLATEEQRWVKRGKSVWLYIDLVFFMPDRRIRDSHNMLKLLLDVMQGVVYDNDYYVLPRIQSVEYDKENPRVELCVSTQTKSEREKGLKVTASVV